MSVLDICLIVGFLILMWRLGEIQNELATLREKFEAREEEHENNPLATKEDLGAAASQKVEAVQDIEGAMASHEPKDTSTTFPVIMPAHYQPPR